MKIGIITFSQALNYGALLQEYALSYKLRELGYACEIVDYENEKFKKEYSVKYSGSFKNEVKRIITLKKYWSALKRKNFMRFESKYITKSQIGYNKKTISKLENNYDLLISGSDQVFNFDLTGGDLVYYLSGISKEKSMAYAPSFGVEDLPSNWDEKSIRDSLKNIRYLSAREFKGAQIIEKLTGKKVQTVLDPTLLLEENLWKKFVHKNHVKKKYLLLYTFEEGKICKFAEEIAGKYSLQIVKINAGIRDLFNPRICVKNGAGIEDFLTLIYHSDMVITNSYHGMIFSFIFNTPFFVFPHISNASINSRMKDFLEMFDMSDRLIADENIQLANSDFTAPKKKLESYREQSIRFIVDSIADYGEKNGK